ncbi:hypothetical protein CAEBREN_09091 [Caenorhabditis brenneri]|uniref:Calpain catalytic domain-containing protein n=1 Tax=Caenorhabditis brenneri TaxID=135651 RepID=G0P351_CAEBE|nr:hypothetical protein CAEBREN_09091 [Caenorhabditis brenneri]
MTITVEFATTKEEIFKKGDEECQEIAEKLRKTGEVYIDPDFPPYETSIGVLKHKDTGEVQVQKSEPWLQPKEFIKPHYLREDCVDEWKVWDNPQPFHVKQGDLGNCGLMAALVAIAQKKGLIEQIVPKKDYTMDCGIVQVRLFVDGEWKVIKTDFLIPQKNGWERFSKMTKRQCWVAFIEKAFAKVKGSYGQLHSFCPTEAFTCLTGHPSKRNWINSETNCDTLWEDLVKYNSSGYLLAAATPKIKEASEEEKKYEEVDIDTDHAYAILGLKEHDDHRLLRLGHGNRMRFTGTWSHLHAYDNEFLEDLCPLDREMSNSRIFWMEIKDFRRLFLCYYVGEYQKESTVLEFKETFRRKQGDDMQILRLTNQKHCELEVGIKTFKNGKRYKHNLFLNIHKCFEDNQCGELLHSFNAYGSQLESDKVPFHPGVYLLIFVRVQYDPCMENEWTIWSSTALDKSQIQFISCPFSVHYRSVTEVILKYGEAEKIEQDQIVVYKWRGKYNCIFMIDNLQESEYVYVKCKITSGNEEELWTCLSFFNKCWHPVPPMSRSIVGVVASNKYEPITVTVDVQYSINYLYFKWINRFGAWIDRDHLENFTPLEFEN